MVLATPAERLFSMKARYLRAAAFAALIVYAVDVRAASSSIVTIPGATTIGTCSTWTSLGTGPLRLYTTSNVLSYAVSDSTPSSQTDLIPLPANIDKDVPSASTIWICNSATQSNVALRIASISAPLPLAGVGAMTTVPAGSTNGTPLGTIPSGAKGVRFYLPSGASLTYTIAAAQPTSAPSPTFTISQSSTGPNWDENLNGQMIYVTAVSGAPLFRWY